MTFWGKHDTDIYAAILLVYQLVHSGGVIGVSPAPGKIAVLVVHESEDNQKITRGQDNAMYGNKKGGIRDWLTTHVAKDTNGNPEFQLIDKDDDVTRDAKWAQDAFAKWKTDAAGKVPWLVVVHPSTTFSGPLPEKYEDTFATLKKYGGQ